MEAGGAEGAVEQLASSSSACLKVTLGQALRLAVNRNRWCANCGGYLRGCISCLGGRLLKQGRGKSWRVVAPEPLNSAA